MLDSYVIARLLEKEKEEQEQEQPRIYIDPPMDYEGSPKPVAEEADRGVIVIDY